MPHAMCNIQKGTQLHGDFSKCAMCRDRLKRDEKNIYAEQRGSFEGSKISFIDDGEDEEGEK